MSYAPAPAGRPPERISPRKKFASDATPEERFKYKWLIEHSPLDSASELEKREWRMCMEADDCRLLRYKKTEELVPLSSSLSAAWVEEQARQERSRIQAEWDRDAAIKKQQQRESSLKVRRQEAKGEAKALHDAGLVPLHEPMNYDHIQGGSDIEPEGSEEQELVQKDFGSDEEAYEKAVEAAAAQKVQLVSHKTAAKLHKLKQKPLKSIAEVKRKRGGSGASSSSKDGGSQAEDETEDEQEEEDELEERKQSLKKKKAAPKSTPTLPAPTPEQQLRINKLFTQALAVLAKDRVANPIQNAATFQAIQDAATQEATVGREGGFAGSALAPPLPPFYNKFKDHIRWK